MKIIYARMQILREKKKGTVPQTWIPIKDFRKKTRFFTDKIKRMTVFNSLDALDNKLKSLSPFVVLLLYYTAAKHKGFLVVLLYSVKKIGQKILTKT